MGSQTLLAYAVEPLHLRLRDIMQEEVKST